MGVVRCERRAPSARRGRRRPASSSRSSRSRASSRRRKRPSSSPRCSPSSRRSSPSTSRRRSSRAAPSTCARASRWTSRTTVTRSRCCRSLVYGDPPMARIDGDDVIALGKGKQVPVRRRDEERQLVQRLRAELDLIPGRRVDFDGTDATRFAAKLREWQKRAGGDEDGAVFEGEPLHPRLVMSDDGTFDVVFEHASERDDDASDRAPAARAEARRRRDGHPRVARRARSRAARRRRLGSAARGLARAARASRGGSARRARRDDEEARHRGAARSRRALRGARRAEAARASRSSRRS